MLIYQAFPSVLCWPEHKIRQIPSELEKKSQPEYERNLEDFISPFCLVLKKSWRSRPAEIADTIDVVTFVRLDGQLAFLSTASGFHFFFTAISFLVGRKIVWNVENHFVRQVLNSVIFCQRLTSRLGNGIYNFSNSY